MNLIPEETQKQVLNKKCSIHPKINCTLLNVNTQCKLHRICLRCMKEQQLSQNEVIDISEIMNYDPSTPLLLFPLNENDEILSQIQSMQNADKKMIDSIKVFFLHFLKDVKQTLKKIITQISHKTETFTSLFQKSNPLLLQSAQISQLQQILTSFNQIEEQELHECFLKYNQDFSSSRLKNDLDQLESMQKSFQTEQSEIIKEEILKLIQQINFFGENQQKSTQIQILPPLPKIKPIKLVEKLFIPTLGYQTSEDMKIEVIDSIVKITNTSESYAGGQQCYFVQELDQSQRYVIKLSILNCNFSLPLFSLGLINSKYKDFEWMGSFDKIHYRQRDGGDVTKVVKGSYLNTYNQYGIGKKEFEIRIHIEKQLFMICSLDHQNAQELESKYSIDLTQRYYFAISLGSNSDQVLVNEILEVEEYEDLW